MFQGGVAANVGIRKAFEETFRERVYVPDNFDVMGAIGVAILAKEEVKKKGYTNFRGTSIHRVDYVVNGFECDGCSNICEVIEIKEDGKLLARYGDKCGKWSNIIDNKDSKLA